MNGWWWFLMGLIIGNFSGIFYMAILTVGRDLDDRLFEARRRMSCGDPTPVPLRLVKREPGE